MNMRLILILAMLGSGTEAMAFTLNGSSALRGWPAETVTFYVNYDNCPVSEGDLNSMIDRAAALWNSVPSSGVTIRRGGSSTVTASQATDSSFYATLEETPVIICDTDLSTNIGQDSENIPGAASFAVDSSTLEIAHGFLLLNAESGKAANIGNDSVQEKLDLIIAHEIGHVMGLGHTSDVDALMYFNATAKTEMNLSQDDIDAITYLYPRSEFGGDGLLGCGSLALRGGGSGGSSGGGFSGGLGVLSLLAFCFLGAQALKVRRTA